MDTHGPGEGGFRRQDIGRNESAPESGTSSEDRDTVPVDSDAVVIAVEFGAGPGGRRRTG